MNTQKVIAGYIRKGNGPNELISAWSTLHRHSLILRDGTACAVACINIDSALIGYVHKPIITRLEGSAHPCVFIDEMLTMVNPYYINDGFGVNGLPEFIQYDVKTGKLLANYKNNDKNFPANLTQRSIAYCNSKYIAFWYCFPIITIYDKDFNLMKMYRDDKFNDPAVVNIGGEFSELLSDGFNEFFMFGCQTENHIIAINVRGQMLKSEFQRKGGYQWAQNNSADFTLTRCKNQEIWCFDNDMNLVRRFKCSDTIGFIRSVSYNEKSKTLYINAMDEDEEYCLYRCVFEK